MLLYHSAQNPKTIKTNKMPSYFFIIILCPYNKFIILSSLFPECQFIEPEERFGRETVIICKKEKDKILCLSFYRKQEKKTCLEFIFFPC